jgi:glycerol-3-phosphate dehydrogenase (NAD(P)+)
MAAITILGGGGWGTALSVLLAGKGHKVTLWVRRSSTAELLRRDRTNERQLPGVILPADMHTTSSFAGMSSAEYFLWATPSTALGEICRMLLESKHFGGNSVMVSCVKRLDHQPYHRMTEILEEISPELPTAVLSGPNHIEEVSRSIPSATVIASREPEVAEALQSSLSTRAFRIYTSTDVVGVEIGGALKNIFALAAGFCDGLGRLLEGCVGHKVFSRANPDWHRTGRTSRNVPRAQWHWGSRGNLFQPTQPQSTSGRTSGQRRTFESNH